MHTKRLILYFFNWLHGYALRDPDGLYGILFSVLNFLICLNLDSIAQRSFRFRKKLSAKYKVPLCSMLHTRRVSPTINIPPLEGIFVTINELHRHITIIQSPQFTLGFTDVVHAMGLGKCTCIHHYSIRQNSCTSLKIL